MPCRDYYSDFYESAESARRLDRATRLLCALIKGVQCNDAGIYMAVDIQQDGDLERWWKAHQAADNEQREQEHQRQKQAEIKKSAIAKLTGEERAALGV
jgi:hypothetical protein